MKKHTVEISTGWPDEKFLVGGMDITRYVTGFSVEYDVVNRPVVSVRILAGALRIQGDADVTATVHELLDERE